MNFTCKICKASYEITSLEKEYFSKWEMPLPENCPDCRFQQRLITRNELTLYKRKCDKSGSDIVSMYHPDVLFPVYSQKEWWGDSWNGDDYAQDFDFEKPFFEQ